MRFAIFAAFMLPLAALAAPITSSDLIKISNPLTRTSVEVESVVRQLFGHTKNSPLRALETAQLANATVFFGIVAMRRIFQANVISDNEYVDSLCAYTIVKNELTRLFCS